jgi:putative transposase
MQLVEQHVITPSDPRFALIDAAAFASKNLYNAANYVLREAFIFDGRILSYRELHCQMKGHEAYRLLPAKVAEYVLRILGKNWQAFLAARAAYQENPGQCLTRPRLPRYKHKTEGRNQLVYTLQSISKAGLRHGMIRPSKLPITIQTKQSRIVHVRILPRLASYVVEVVYERQASPPQGDPTLYAGVDIGVNNLAAIASNKAGFVPRLVNGRPAKSINQFFNQRLSELRSVLEEPASTKRMERLITKRARRLNQYFHAASQHVIALLVQEGIGTLVIGKSPLWKEEMPLGRCIGQHVAPLPLARFVEMLTYKAQLAGIQVLITEESYTSQCSFLDLEAIGKHERYLGKRVKRGLFRSASGRCLNADVNGAYNIIRKVAPDAFGKGVEAVVVQPVRQAV